MSDDFANAPFARALAGLDRKQLPVKGMKHEKSAGQRAREAKRAARQAARDPEGEQELFLAHMHGVNRGRGGQSPAVTEDESACSHILARLGMEEALLGTPEPKDDDLDGSDDEPVRKRLGGPALEEMGRRINSRRQGPGEYERECALFARHMAREARPGRDRGRTGTFSLAESGGLDGLVAAGSAVKRGRGGSGSAASGTAAAVSRTADRTTGRPAAARHSPDAPAEEEQTMRQLLNPDAEPDPAFAAAMSGVEPIRATGRDVARAVETRDARVASGNALQDFMDGKLEFAVHCTDEYIEGHVVGLDLIIVGKLRQGGFSPEDNVDLHGLNIQQAYERMAGFIRGCWYRGMRCVIIVPGRGNNSPGGVPVLREKVRQWLTQDPFKRVVLAVRTARPRDGGPGSRYVLLRKDKKKGRVYWDRTPLDADLL